MTRLVILLPERPRLPAAAQPPSPLFEWLLLADDGQQLAEGQDLPAALPPADQLLLLLPEQGLSWHRVTLPRAARKRWRAALIGLLEEELLEDPEQLLLAVEDEAAPGETSWVAATPLAPLREAIARLEGTQRLVDRILPRAWPLAEGRGHFFVDALAGAQLRWADADGVITLPLRGSFARARYAPSLVQSSSWSASAEAQEAAEHWLGMRLSLASPAEQARLALDGPWDLRQFELAPRLHGMRWLRQLGHQLMHRQWQAARRGLAALLLLGLVGVNLLAWQQRSQIAERQQQIEAVLRASFPQIRHVLEPGLQMQRELNLLRARAGELGAEDLESLIAALAAHWPPTRGPVDALHYENGQLGLPDGGWTEEQIAEFGRQLASEGWLLSREPGRLLVKRSAS